MEKSQREGGSERKKKGERKREKEREREREREREGERKRESRAAATLKVDLPRSLFNTWRAHNFLRFPIPSHSFSVS